MIDITQEEYILNTVLKKVRNVQKVIAVDVTVANQSDVRANIKKYFDMACDGRAVMIPRKDNRNVVILSEKEYHTLQKVKRNAEYLLNLDRANEQIRSGKVVVKTMEELEAMAE